MLGWRLPMDLQPHQPLHISARSHESDFGAVGLLSTKGSGATVVRDARLAGDDTSPMVILSVLGSGTSVLDQHDRAAHLRVGDLVAYSSTAPFRSTFHPGTTRHSYLIPAELLGIPNRLVRDLVARPFGPGLPLARVVSSFLVRLATEAPSMNVTQRQAMEESAISLARALLTASSGDDAQTARALAATLGTRIKEYLQAHLTDPDLSAAMVAAAHGISERHLYTVLARQDISLRPWLRERRLAGAAQALTRPVNKNVTIAALAHRWGFADHAHFTREFRKRYGITPTGWRNTASPH